MNFNRVSRMTCSVQGLGSNDREGLRSKCIDSLDDSKTAFLTTDISQRQARGGGLKVSTLKIAFWYQIHNK